MIIINFLSLYQIYDFHIAFSLLVTRHFVKMAKVSVVFILLGKLIRNLVGFRLRKKDMLEVV